MQLLQRLVGLSSLPLHTTQFLHIRGLTEAMLYSIKTKVCSFPVTEVPLKLACSLEISHGCHAVEANIFGASVFGAIGFGAIAFGAIALSATATEAISFRANTSEANSDY